MAFVPFAAGAANAAPPDNDEATGARALNVGDHVTQDTTEATTTPADAAFDTLCGAPFTNASVWYKYTAVKAGNVALDTSASSYTTGLMVFKGTPSANTYRGCGPDLAVFSVRAGTTYTVMVFSDTETIGGTLDLVVKNVPKPKVHVTLAKRGVALRGGAAQLHGTYSCTHAESFGEVDAHLYQRAGRLKIQADSFPQLLCDGKRHGWSARLVSQVGTYVPGAAKGVARMTVCGEFLCSKTKAKASLQLKPKSGAQRVTTHRTHATTEASRSLHSLHRAWPKS